MVGTPAAREVLGGQYFSGSPLSDSVGHTLGSLGFQEHLDPTINCRKPSATRHLLHYLYANGYEISLSIALIIHCSFIF